MLSAVLATVQVRAQALTEERVEPQAEVSFERQARPVLKAYCLDCHGGEHTNGGLDLRLRRFAIKGGDSGAAISPGDSEHSLIMQKIRAGEMPPGEKKVPAADVAILERWIQAGAPTLRAEPAEIPPGIGITEEERSYWFFQPITEPELPLFSDPVVRTPIDALLMSELTAKGLTFSPDADRRTLIRRAMVDLHGVVPTPEEVRAFEEDQSPDAWEKLVDRLLDSPRYGERWGRHWLDVAGYADSEGATNADAERPNAWRYRDYVVRSFNADKPASLFIQEQLAGDEMAGPRGSELTPEQIELLTATGFLTMAANGTGSGDDSPQARNQCVADTLKIVTTSLMGLSVGCAQCHDHRYDPISHVDYYRLRAIFDPAMDWQNWRTPASWQVSLYTDADRAKAAEVEQRAVEVSNERNAKQTEFLAAALETELGKYEQPLRDQLKAAYETEVSKRTAEQQDLLKKYPAVNISPGVLYQYNQAAADELKKYDERIAAIRTEKPVENFLRAFTEPPGHLPKSFRFHRGEFGQPKEEVTPGDLQVASLFTNAPSIPVDDPALPTTGRRLAFARWLTSGQHPLVSRVLMNRLWLNHFGRTFVGTAGEFGKLGEQPVHPKLLDWLASDFMKGGWTWKRMHRQIMLSTVYRQSSAPDAAKEAIDPINQLYWRKPVIRMDAESIRDAMLVVSGQFKEQSGGPPVPMKADDTGQIVEAESTGRRSLYLQVRRSQPNGMLSAFDAPVMETNCPARSVSNSAPQSLMMMNSQFALTAAERMADRCLATTNAAQVPALPGLEALKLPRMSVWEFGYGAVVDGRVDFHPLSFWDGSRYQAGPQLPDPVHGWVMVNAQGGHTGDAAHASIRRMTVPAEGTLKITGALSRPAPNGDGVRARIFSSAKGLLGEWKAPTGSVETPLEIRNVVPGEVIDLVVDCVETVESDSFAWTVVASLTGPEGQNLGSWNSEQSLYPPATSPERLPVAVESAWQFCYGRAPVDAERQAVSDFVRNQFEYLTTTGKGRAPDVVRQIVTDVCQTLMSSNEFLYVE
ncbi:MAG: PSD1 domain-containing protein [Planctomycetaceae bacterium]|nr:PSD1 domain-containing protein [Planctomycetaceae bacterium]